MPENEPIREKLDRLVASALEDHVANLRKALTEQILAELRASVGPEQVGGSPTGLLKGAIASLHEATTQTDILRSLLDGTASFSARAGLLVVRANMAHGWQSRGFDDEQAFRALTVDCTRGLASRVLASQSAAAGTISDFDGPFASRFGAPRDGNVILVPLVIKDKVAAFIYADAGASGALDTSAIELLVQAAAMWLEVQTLRRAAGVSEPAPRQREQATQPVHAAPGPVTPPSATPSPAQTLHAGGNGSPSTSVAENGSAPSNGTGHVGGDDEVHTKARRFAKLLVDEIKLYNQAKVAEGRQARDLYDRLKEDIEKSRATYQRRYGHVNDVDYFRQELVRVLADNDASLLGATFGA